MNNDITSPAPSGEEGDSDSIAIGERLRAGREHLGLDVETLARRLRLTTTVIRRLEAGELNDLAAPAYVRGYVANYAREVDLDPGPLLEAMGARSAGQEPAPEVKLIGRRVGILERYSTLFNYALATGIVLFSVLFWLQTTQGPNPEGPTATSADQPEAGERQRPIMASMTPSLGEPRVSDVLEAPEAGPPAPETLDALTAPANMPEPPAPVWVEVAAKADSWVEIEDASGARLEYDLLQAGEERRYPTAGVLRFRIGNAASSHLRIDGQDIDLLPHSRGDVAVLTWEGTPTPR